MTDRRKAEEAGRSAERLAALWMMLKGYRILARRYRGRGGEIDLIAAKPFLGRPSVICFVEVKQRQDRVAFADAISQVQRRRIESAAAQFMQQKPQWQSAVQRFDGVFVRPGVVPVHATNLWSIGE